MTSELKLDEGSDVVVVQGGMKVAFNASGITVNAPGTTITVDKNGKVAMQSASNDSARAAAPKAHEVGEHLKDGTVCVAVDLEKNEALFMPEGIFGGKSTFDDQDEVVQEANRNKLHGHGDWRRTTDGENEKLSEVWNKVAPPALQGSAAPWFWGASASYDGLGRVWRGGEADWYDVTPGLFASGARRLQWPCPELNHRETF